ICYQNQLKFATFMLNKKRIFLWILFSTVLLNSMKSESFHKTNYGIKSTVGNVEIEIQFYNPSTVRVLKWPQNTSFSKNSLSVIATPQATSLSFNQKDNEVIVKSSKIEARLNLVTGSLSFYRLTGGLLLKEK